MKLLKPKITSRINTCHHRHLYCIRISLSDSLCSAPSTANGAAGSQQAQVGSGFSNSSWLHRALPVQAEDLSLHQADPQETCPDLCGTVCYRCDMNFVLNASLCVCKQKTEFWVSQVSNERAVFFIPGKLCCAVLTDVNFIASPPSMVAAGSVAAAVQGLYLKSQDASLSSQNLTNFLSQVIRSDPVWKRFVTYLMFAVQLVLTRSQFCACRTACGHVRSR